MDILYTIKYWLEWTPTIVTTAVVFVIGLIAFHILERIFPPVHSYKTGPTRRGYLADFTASLVEGPVLYALTKIGFYIVIMQMPVLLTDGMSTWPWLVQALLFLLVNDFARYWLHRWHHASDFLWRFHRVHHTVTHMDAMSTFRVHIVEGIMKYGLIVLPFHFVHCSKSVLILYSIVDILKGFWHHANIRTHIGKLNYIFNSAELHWWHHSVEAKGQLANYGSLLSIWDWLFGTAYYEKGVWPAEIGVAGMQEFPDTYHGLLVSATLSDEEAIRRFGGSNNAAADGGPAEAIDSHDEVVAPLDDAAPTESPRRRQFSSAEAPSPPRAAADKS